MNNEQTTIESNAVGQPPVGDRPAATAPTGSASGSTPLRWADFKWPRWIPEVVRAQLRSFWAEDFHRSPRDWQGSFIYAYANHPKMGERVRCRRAGWGHGGRKIRAGRWVPMWNNMGRLVCGNGDVLVQSTNDVIRE